MSRKRGNRRKRGPMGRPRYKPVDVQLRAAYPELRSKLAPSPPQPRQGTSNSEARREVPDGASRREGPGEDACS
jgi:hypothetical protein